MSTTLDFQCSYKNPSKVGGTGTSVKYFPRTLGSSITSGATTPNASNPAGALWLPTGAFGGKIFAVRVAGNFGYDTGDPSGTVNVQLFAVTGTLASPVYTAIASLSPYTPEMSSPYPFALDVTLSGDSTSGILAGYYTTYGVNQSGNSGLLNSSPKAIDTYITGLDYENGNPALQRGAVLGFAVGATFGTSNATNTASLYQFQIIG